MAQSDRQGTGRHPHKSPEEPYPHTKENQGQDEHRSRSSHETSHSGGSDRSSQSSHRGESERSSHGSSHGGGSSRTQRQGSSSEDADLKEREYRDEKGEIHHHTRTYMEQHKGERNK